jgi:hypothetical protein
MTNAEGMTQMANVRKDCVVGVSSLLQPGYSKAPGDFAHL